MTPDLRLGYSHPTLRLTGDALALIGAHDVKHVEIRVDDIDRGSLLFDSEYRRSLRSLRDTKGLTLSAHSFAGVNLAERIDRLRATSIDLFREQIEFCDDIGAEWLTLHAGTCGFSSDSGKKASRAQIAAESIRRLIEQTGGSRVRLAVENVRRIAPGLLKCYVGDDVYELASILDASPQRVGFVFDTGHANLDGASTPESLLKPLLPRLIAAHVHANNGSEDTHAALTQQWIDERRPTFNILAQTEVPLIAEHHRLADAADTLRVLSCLRI